jgi:hypothetical protein
MLMAMTAVVEHTALADIERRLAGEFPHASPGDLSSAIKQAYARFDTSPIRDFIPLFVEKRARRQLASADGTTSA